jgi:predicted RNase H-like nuclease (RuvC/YqgF family)
VYEVGYSKINSFFQKQIQELVNTPSGSATSQLNIATDSEALQTEINNLRKQLKMSKDEADKLRDQLSDRYSVAVMSVWKSVAVDITSPLMNIADITPYGHT